MADWARSVLDIVIAGVNDATDYQMRQLSPDVNGEQHYTRSQAKLTEGNDDMGDAGKTNPRALGYLAEECLRNNFEVVERLIGN